jgi:hypothetical protein
MYDHQSRLTIAHSIADDRMAEARRSRLAGEARAAGRAPSVERVQADARPGFIARLVGAVRAASAGPTPAHHGVHGIAH